MPVSKLSIPERKNYKAKEGKKVEDDEHHLDLEKDQFGANFPDYKSNRETFSSELDVEVKKSISQKIQPQEPVKSRPSSRGRKHRKRDDSLLLEKLGATEMRVHKSPRWFAARSSSTTPVPKSSSRKRRDAGKEFQKSPGSEMKPSDGSRPDGHNSWWLPQHDEDLENTQRVYSSTSAEQEPEKTPMKGNISEKGESVESVEEERKLCNCIKLRVVVAIFTSITLAMDIILTWHATTNFKGHTPESALSVGIFLQVIASTDAFITMVALIGTIIRKGSLLSMWVYTRLFYGLVWVMVALLTIPSFTLGLIIFLGIVLSCAVLALTLFVEIISFRHLVECYQVYNDDRFVPDQLLDTLSEDEYFRRRSRYPKQKKKHDKSIESRDRKGGNGKDDDSDEKKGKGDEYGRGLLRYHDKGKGEGQEPADKRKDKEEDKKGADDKSENAGDEKRKVVDIKTDVSDLKDKENKTDDVTKQLGDEDRKRSADDKPVEVAGSEKNEDRTQEKKKHKDVKKRVHLSKNKDEKEMGNIDYEKKTKDHKGKEKESKKKTDSNDKKKSDFEVKTEDDKNDEKKPGESLKTELNEKGKIKNEDGTRVKDGKYGKKKKSGESEENDEKKSRDEPGKEDENRKTSVGFDKKKSREDKKNVRRKIMQKMMDQEQKIIEEKEKKDRDKKRKKAEKNAETGKTDSDKKLEERKDNQQS